MNIESVCVVGLGYIGLPTATLFAHAGLRVRGVDINANIVETVNSGRAHFGEPDLDALLSTVVSNGRLAASLEPCEADAFILAVPTPFEANRKPELRYVYAAARSVAPKLKRGDLLILESTSPVGTTELVRDLCAAERPDLTFPGNTTDVPDINISYCPERVLPGRILHELANNPRVIGGLSPRCGERASALYGRITNAERRIVDARTAELVKLAENAFRDVNIAFANELSMLCDEMNINVWELIGIANLHPRVDILAPGSGVGGHCIAVDPWFIINQVSRGAPLMRTARAVNDAKPHFVADKIVAQADALGRRPVIACFGLSYKADVDDLRESPSVEIVKELARKEIGEILAIEPHIENLPDALDRMGVALADIDTALQKADILAFLVGHESFRSIDSARFGNRPVIDPCGIWAAERVRDDEISIRKMCHRQSVKP